MYLVAVKTTLLLLGYLIGQILAYSSGPPIAACSNMIPSGHGVDAQQSNSPISITVSKNTYSAGDTLTVTLSTKDSSVFKGFYVQARPTNGAMTALGTFTGGTDQQLHNCLGSASSAVSHNSPADKQVVTLTWQPSSNGNVDIKFRVTLVQSRPVFWVGFESVIIRYSAQPPSTDSPMRTTNRNVANVTSTRGMPRNSTETIWPTRRVTAPLPPISTGVSSNDISRCLLYITTAIILATFYGQH